MEEVKAGAVKTGEGLTRDAGEVQLTERDAWALGWAGEQYGCRVDQLQRLLGMDEVTPT